MFNLSFKAEYVLSNGLGGAMVWALDFDDFTGACCSNSITSPLLTTIERKFTGFGPAVHDIISNCSYSGIDAANLPAQGTTVQNGGGGPVLPAKGVVSSVQVDGVDCSDPDIQLQLDPKSCKHFYLCSNGRPVRMTCPAKLLWNDFMKYCDWPRNAICISST